MKAEYYITLSIYGRKAVKIGYVFQSGYCYKGIYEHDKRIAQLEVVIDAPGQYNGFENAWVDVTCEKKDVEKTLNQLKKIGFDGCYALIVDRLEESDKVSEKEYCFIRI